MIGVFTTRAAISDVSDMALALRLACDDGHDQQVSIAGFSVARDDDPEGGAPPRLVLLRYLDGAPAASPLLTPAGAADFAPLAWKWFTESHGEGRACRLRTGRRAWGEICEILAVNPQENDVSGKVPTCITGSGRSRLIAALGLCLPERKGRVCSWSFLHEEDAQKFQTPTLLASPKVSALHLHAAASTGDEVRGTTRLISPVPASLAADLAAEWLRSADLVWPRKPDTDGDCQRGFRVELVAPGHVKVVPAWMVYGK